ncbi:glycosyltransferase family A protein [Streptomyces sp. TG1A-8]|uniref:glycosyltransferase family 2 protein n=1 Tax=Streptomyces sp. TG1A-8 TaxID=3051385 RepID=UPI00265C0F0E|nr:glycosyltransferase family A protein [Streptomyces sp. TG1A-8]MDO0925041.1 glycosyltransferase family A protein [Streptomyces sp. TG1A-8]
MNRLDVVIPCHNSAHCVGRQLAALGRQRTAVDWGLVIVDDGSDDDLAAVVSAHASRLPDVRIINRPRRGGTGAARNTGARAATAEGLLFLDADDEIADGYLDAMAAALAEADLVTARIDYQRLNPPTVLRRTPADQLCDVLTVSLFKAHVLGGLMGMSRELFDRLGGFDESLPALADVDISWRAQLAGHTIGVADTVVSVSVRGTHRGRLRRGRFQGRDAVALRAKHAPYGARPLGWAAHLADWLALPAQVARAGRPAALSALVWELGWQTGVLGALLAGASRVPVPSVPETS